MHSQESIGYVGGDSVGLYVGCSVGSGVVPVGKTDGEGLGIIEGLGESRSVVGKGIGVLLGRAVGDGDGDLVGKSVGVVGGTIDG